MPVKQMMVQTQLIKPMIIDEKVIEPTTKPTPPKPMSYKSNKLIASTIKKHLEKEHYQINESLLTKQI